MWHHVGRTQSAAAAPPTAAIVCQSRAMLEVAEGSPPWACGVGTAFVANVTPLSLPSVDLRFRSLPVAYGVEGVAVDPWTRDGDLAVGA